MAITILNPSKPVLLKDNIKPKQIVGALPEPEVVETPTPTATSKTEDQVQKGGFFAGTYTPYIVVIVGVLLIAVIIVFGKKIKFLAD